MTIAVRYTQFSFLNYIFLSHFSVLGFHYFIITPTGTISYVIFQKWALISNVVRFFFPASCQISLRTTKIRLDSATGLFFKSNLGLISASAFLWAKTTRALGTGLISEGFLSPWNMETLVFLALYSDCILSAQLQPSSACAGPVITCFYHRLVQAVRWHWEQWVHENKSPIKSKGMCEPGTNLSKT